MANLTEYTGNAGLGVGSNADIPVTTSKDLDLINETSRDIYINGLNRNTQLFQQKVADRDKLLSAIDSGDIKTGDLLEQDTPVVKEGLEKLDEAFENRIKKGINDLDAAREYKKALREAQDRVTQAQGRKVFYDSESGAIGQETLPRKQDARKKNLDGVIKGGFWKDIQPYQQTQDLDIQGSILSTAANISTPFTDPKTLTKGTKTEFDYGKTLDANVTNFLNDANKRYDQQQLVREIQELDPDTFDKTMKSMNNRIDEYNKRKNLSPNSPGYAEPIKYDIIEGKGVIAEKQPDFAAKYTLANQKPFGSSTSEFDKDAASYQLGKERNRIAQQNANTGLMKARAYTARQNKKLKDMTDVEKRQKGFWDGIVGRVKEAPLPNGEKTDLIWGNDLPAGYKNINGIDESGRPIKLEPIKQQVKIGTKKTGTGKVVDDFKTIEVYGTRYLSSDGNTLDLRKQYEEYKAGGGKGSYSDLRTKLLKSGDMSMELVGANGVGDFQTAMETARAISNKVSTKGEEGVFEETQVDQSIE